MRHVVELGCSAADGFSMDCCDMIVMEFLFKVCAVSMNPLQRKDMNFDDNGLMVSFLLRKGKSVRCSPILRYWAEANPVAPLSHQYDSDRSLAFYGNRNSSPY